MEQAYYDTTLRLLSYDVAMYEWQEKTMQRPRLASTTWLAGEVGQIGVLVVNERSGEAGFFQPYLEQRLRRAMQYDVADRWGWTLERQNEPLLVRMGVIPGIDGKVIEDHTNLLMLAIPPEFDALCAMYKHDVESVLRGFIADACGLKNEISALASMASVPMAAMSTHRRMPTLNKLMASGASSKRSCLTHMRTHTGEGSMEQSFYNVRLKTLTSTEAVYEWEEKIIVVLKPAHTEQLEQQIGQLGLLVIDEEGGEPGFFTPYVEQRLRRAGQYDHPHHWAWQLVGTDKLILAQAGTVPGIDGKVIIDDTRPLVLACPPEFDDVCSYYNQQAEDVLRAFIADACGLLDNPELPREDGYHSDASDEQQLASRYMAAVYGIYRRTVQ